MPDATKPFDVFLSHSHADADFVRQLAEELEDKHGCKAWLDQWELIPGRPFVRGTAKGLNEAASCAVCLGENTPAGWFQNEIEKALDRQTQESEFGVIPVILPGGDRSTVDGFLKLRSWVDLRKGLSDREAMHKLVSGIKGLAPGRTLNQRKDPASLFTVPFADNPFFTERGNELAELRELLNQRGVAALTGMGGMGKTQTASRYCHRHREDYPAVLWVRAENEETLFADFTALARQLDLPEATAQEQKLMVEAVMRWLGEQPCWLLVLDNVVELNFVRDLMRKAHVKGRHIIVTTQSQATGAIAAKDLPLMKDQVGAELLLRRANFIPPGAPLSDARPRDVEVAKAISEKLGGLPLALDQAGAYISETGTGLTDYRELLNERLPELLARRGDLDNEHESVARTFVKSLAVLGERNSAAAELMRVMGFLAPDAVPEEIFTEGAPGFAGALQAAASDKLAWNEAIAATLKFSLLDRDADKKTLSVHRTVQAVARWNMGKEERAGWAEQVVRAVDAALPEPEFANWPAFERLLPHAQACAAHIEEFDISIPEAARLLNQAGCYLYKRARFAEAEPLYRRALAIDEKGYGRDHPNVAIRLNNLALLLKDTNRLVEAEPLYRRALAIDEKAYSPDHPDVAIDLNNLARLLQATNRLEEAEPLMRRALAIDEKALGPEHPDVAIDLNNLAQLLQDTNRLEEAELLMCRALAIDERAYGPDHPDVARDLNNLAQLLQATNRLKEAEPLMRHALAIDEKAYGPDHPDVAIDLNNLARLLKATNRLEEAEPLMRRAVSIAEKALGSDHPSTITFSRNLDFLLRQRAAEA
jgi:tetratricopeptide (TPR) repeat protein